MPRCGCGGSPAARQAPRRAAPSQASSSASSPRTRSTPRSPSGDVHRVGEGVERAQVRHRRAAQGDLEGAPAPLPVDERAGLLRRGRDRQDDVRAPGHLARPDLEADDEAGGVERGERLDRVGQVVRVDPADDESRRSGPRAQPRASRWCPGPGPRATTGHPRRWRRRRGRPRRRPGGRRAAATAVRPPRAHRAPPPGEAPRRAGRRWRSPAGRRRRAPRARPRAARRRG